MRQVRFLSQIEGPNKQGLLLRLKPPSAIADPTPSRVVCQRLFHAALAKGGKAPSQAILDARQSNAEWGRLSL